MRESFNECAHQCVFDEMKNTYSLMHSFHDGHDTTNKLNWFRYAIKLNSQNVKAINLTNEPKLV